MFQASQTQDDITAELGTTFIDEPSQSELEEELTAILEDTAPRRLQPAMSDNPEDEELERELQRVLDLSADSTKDSSSINDLLNGRPLGIENLYEGSKISQNL